MFLILNALKRKNGKITFEKFESIDAISEGNMPSWYKKHFCSVVLGQGLKLHTLNFKIRTP
jgi:hypothetical protein